VKKLINELKKFEIELEIIEMESDGCYLPRLKKVFVNQSLDEIEMKKVVYHELFHGIEHAEFAALYHLPTYHSKMEREADNYMITSIIEENDGEYNVTSLLEAFGIPMGYEVRFAQ